ncbi:uncharacterized protein LTR77_008641 [Saxophila tyrrhenica]|uniref:Thioesterase domain-containing protein n=1 Tax=Saxophila tyrrhenica TaxID=1690608 RepID=A0AAV9P2N4_9PEZI|nr:hypothetical protein LTR77_008641 [Saxophila tyrrhenica]
MSIISKLQQNLGHSHIAAHPDFTHDWCKQLLANPDIRWNTVTDEKNASKPDKVSNTMFEYTLYSDRGIRSHLSFRRPSKEPEAVDGWEACFLLSIGDGVDGKTGRAHGGFNGVILDHISGHIAHNASPNPISPATATMTIDYKAPVSTPCVVLARAWLIEMSGRKVWVKAILQDGEGKAYATSKCLFILAREPKM